MLQEGPEARYQCIAHATPRIHSFSDEAFNSKRQAAAVSSLRQALVMTGAGSGGARGGDEASGTEELLNRNRADSSGD